MICRSGIAGHRDEVINFARTEDPLSVTNVVSSHPAIIREIMWAALLTKDGLLVWVDSRADHGGTEEGKEGLSTY